MGESRRRSARFEIIVPADDIGLAVMQSLMLVHPEMPGWTEYCRAQLCCPQVRRGRPEERAMIGIVEYAEAERGGRESERQGRDQSRE